MNMTIQAIGGATVGIALGTLFFNPIYAVILMCLGAVLILEVFR